MKRAIGITIAVSLLNGIAFREQAEPWAWQAILGSYLLLAAYAFYTFQREDRLTERFVLRGGDISIGALTGLGLFAVAWLLSKQVVPPGSERMAWLARIYTAIGPIEGNMVRTLGLLAFAAMEEIVWRGMVAGDLKQELGARRAVPIAVGLYALSYLPTVLTLADPTVGKNPLVVLTALGTGLVWTFLAVHTNRLFAVFVSHAVFAYFAGMPLSFM